MPHFVSQKQVDASFAAMRKHLSLEESYHYGNGSTYYTVRIIMGDSAFSMEFIPPGKFPIEEMRIRCLPIITKNIRDIHDGTCDCLHEINEATHTLEILEPDEEAYH